MLFRVFTLHPDIFQGFVSNSLIARGISKEVIDIELVNFRDNFGIGNYKQVDDKPFGGGSGMVIMPEQIMQCMESYNCFEGTGDVYKHGKPRTTPNNSKFFDKINSGQLKTKKVNISLTPRGFPFVQQTAEWIASNFEEVNMVCGRYEGYDERFCEEIDLELSIGNFVLNGGEVASMCLIEAIARLVPDFITKNSSVLHDSFSSGLNNYEEFAFENGDPKFQKQFLSDKTTNRSKNLFDDVWYSKNILPFIEHPQYTRPEIWRGKQVPKVLLEGNHSLIQKWRKRWY
jgi:tRNA (guanine37-N1)-methyltransferase